jgi:hypothetical protein
VLGIKWMGHDFNTSSFLSSHPFTCGNSLKLAKLTVVSERDKNFFTNRVINIWNALPDTVVTSCSFSSFKRNIAKMSCQNIFCCDLVQCHFLFALFYFILSLQGELLVGPTDISSALVILLLSFHFFNCFVLLVLQL